MELKEKQKTWKKELQEVEQDIKSGILPEYLIESAIKRKRFLFFLLKNDGVGSRFGNDVEKYLKTLNIIWDDQFGYISPVSEDESIPRDVEFVLGLISLSESVWI